jgi:hypothetical protein
MGLPSFTSHPRGRCAADFMALKNPSLRPGSKPQPLDSVASTISTTPPMGLSLYVTVAALYVIPNDVYSWCSSDKWLGIELYVPYKRNRTSWLLYMKMDVGAIRGIMDHVWGMTDRWPADGKRPAMSFYAARGMVSRMWMPYSLGRLHSIWSEFCDSQSKSKLSACDPRASSWSSQIYINRQQCSWRQIRGVGSVWFGK